MEQRLRRDEYEDKELLPSSFILFTAVDSSDPSDGNEAGDTLGDKQCFYGERSKNKETTKIMN